MNREESWPWPDSLDALVDAPEYHHVLLENNNVCEFSTFVYPGPDCLPAHTSLARLVTVNLYAVMLTAQFCSIPAAQKRRVSGLCLIPDRLAPENAFSVFAELAPKHRFNASPVLMEIRLSETFTDRRLQPLGHFIRKLGENDSVSARSRRGSEAQTARYASTYRQARQNEGHTIFID